MEENKNLMVEFVKIVLITFAIAVIAVSIGGWFAGDGTKEVGGLLKLGHDGLAYSSILQIFIFSFIQGIINILLLSNVLFKKMMLLWRLVLMFLLSLITAMLLCVLFNWIPNGDRLAWISFIILFSFGFIIGTSAMIIKTKLEDRKYGKLLFDYKAKQKKESGE